MAFRRVVSAVFLNTAQLRCVARLAECHLMHVMFKNIAPILQITGDSVFPLVLLKNGIECALGRALRKYCLSAKLQKYCACAVLGANFSLQAGARSACELQPSVHSFSVEPCGWNSTAQDALAPVRFQRMEHCGESRRLEH